MKVPFLPPQSEIAPMEAPASRAAAPRSDGGFAALLAREAQPSEDGGRPAPRTQERDGEAEPVVAGELVPALEALALEREVAPPPAPSGEEAEEIPTAGAQRPGLALPPDLQPLALADLPSEEPAEAGVVVSTEAARRLAGASRDGLPAAPDGFPLRHGEEVAAGGGSAQSTTRPEGEGSFAARIAELRSDGPGLSATEERSVAAATGPDSELREDTTAGELARAKNSSARGTAGSLEIAVQAETLRPARAQGRVPVAPGSATHTVIEAAPSTPRVVHDGSTGLEDSRGQASDDGRSLPTPGAVARAGEANGPETERTAGFDLQLRAETRAVPVPGPTPVAEAVAPPAAVHPVTTTAHTAAGTPVGSAQEVVPLHVEWLAVRGGGTARIQLDPPQLGQVQLRVTVRGSVVDVVVQAHEPAAQLAVAHTREILADGLATRELRMEHFEVRGAEGTPLGQDEGSGARQHTEHQAGAGGAGADSSFRERADARGPDPGPAGDPRVATSALAEPGLPRSVSSTSPSGIDVHI